ncbi:sigma factor-like helix-turn-helix DNA-binding protein [Streptomyces sp. NPDC055817]
MTAQKVARRPDRPAFHTKEQAWMGLYKRRDQVRELLTARGYSTSVAEEAADYALETGLRKWETLYQPDAYMKQVGSNAALDLMRRRGREMPLDAPLVSYLSASLADSGFDTEIQLLEFDEALARLGLPDTMVRLARLLLGGASLKESAHVLGISYETAGRRRKKLRLLLDTYRESANQQDAPVTPAAAPSTLNLTSLHEAVEALPKKRRQVFQRWMAGAPYPEISDELGITIPNARVHVCHARRRLCHHLRCSHSELDHLIRIRQSNERHLGLASAA